MKRNDLRGREKPIGRIPKVTGDDDSITRPAQLTCACVVHILIVVRLTASEEGWGGVLAAVLPVVRGQGVAQPECG